ncbi:MAG TPA: hypothetical protein PLG65_08575 [Bacillota bacterium]|nr:hypothetical protein [Bacillota bacterium]
MRISINPRLAAMMAFMIAVFGMSVPAMCAEQPKWSLSGDSLFKVYWQTTLRVANETNLAAGGVLGPLSLEGRVRLTGSTWGIPDDAMKIGPWGERLDKWTVSARSGGLSLQLGDTTVPVLSGLYLAGRSLYGGLATAGGRLGTTTGTVTGFYGMNTVSSGLSISTHKLAGGAAELSLSRNLGLVVQGMRATKDQFGLDMGGARAWIRVGTASLNAEVVASRSGSSDDLGWVALAGAQTQLFGGMLSVSGQYTAADFASLNSAAAGKAGGIAEGTAAWSGTVWRGEKGANAYLGIVGKIAADNMDGSLGARTSKQLGEGTLTLRSGAWLVKGRYTLAHEGSDENPPAREKISRVASLEAAVPLKLGAGVLDTGLRGSRSTTVDDVSGSRDVLDTIALTGRTLIGQTSLAANAGWSQSVKSAGDRKRDLEFVLSLSRPVIDKLLQAGLDAKATDSRSFERDSGEVKSLKDALEAALWLKYTPRPWLEAMAKVKGMWGWYGPEPKSTDFDNYLEGQLRLRF